MAPTSKDSIPSAGGDEKFNLVKLAFKCINGTIDFDMFAGKIGSPNGEAARKKFKRIFEKDEEALNLVGSTLSHSSDGCGPTKNRTPRGKATNGGASDSTSAADTRASAKKRKAAEMKEESNDASDAEEVAAPKKKAKAITSTKNPRSPRTPRTPRAPRTPKGAVSPKVEDAEESATDHKDNDSHMIRTGSPEVQAKVDGIVKENEKITGGEVGDTQKQAIHDGVKKKIDATPDNDD